MKRNTFSSHLSPSPYNSHSRQHNNNPHIMNKDNASPASSTGHSQRDSFLSSSHSAGNSHRTPPTRTPHTRAHPYADRRNSTATSQHSTHNYLHDVVPPQLWAIQPDEGRIGSAAIQNAQSLLVHLQSSKTYAAAQTIHRLCEMHNMFDTAAEPPIDIGTTIDLQDQEYWRYNHMMEGLETKIQVVKDTLSHLDDFWQRRVAFPPSRRLNTHNYLHRQYVTRRSTAVRARRDAEQHSVHEETEGQQQQDVSPQ